MVEEAEKSMGEEASEEGEIVEEAGSSVGRALATKHPLEHAWTFWFDNPSAKSKQATWGSSIRPIYTFSTVEDFWSIYNNIHHPSKLADRADLYCFKNKIEPKWEDPVCSNGGKWTMTFSPRGKSDTSWLYTLLAMIGEQFDYGDEICGAVVNVRKQDKISIWTKDAMNEAAQVSIGKQWKNFLDYNDQIGFIFHDDAKKFDRSAKNKYTV